MPWRTDLITTRSLRQQPRHGETCRNSAEYRQRKIVQRTVIAAGAFYPSQEVGVVSDCFDCRLNRVVEGKRKIDGSRNAGATGDLESTGQMRNDVSVTGTAAVAVIDDTESSIDLAAVDGEELVMLGRDIANISRTFNEVFRHALGRPLALSEIAHG